MDRPRPDASPPRFRQIFEGIRSEIVAGVLSEHAALPSERAVAAQYCVSRMTARRALEVIEAQGLAYSECRRGRFVSPKGIRYDIGNCVSLGANARTAGTDLGIEVVRKRSFLTDETLSAKLAVRIDEVLHEITRLFSINGHPTLIETEVVVAGRCPELLDRDLHQSTIRLFEELYGITARTGDVVIRMRTI